MYKRSSFLVAGGVTLVIMALVFVSFTIDWGTEKKTGTARQTEVTKSEVSRMNPHPTSVAPTGRPTGPGAAGTQIARETSVKPSVAPAVEQPDVDPYKEGVMQFREGRYAEASRNLQIAVDRGKEGFNPRYLLGLAYRFSGEPGDAARVLEEAAEIKPAFGKVWVNLARAYLETGEVEAAKEAAEKSVELAGDLTDAWNVLGRVRLAEGHVEFAEDAFEKAIQIDSTNAHAQNNLGYSLILQERFEEAVAPLSLAVTIEPGVPYMHNNLGIALERTGKLELAREAFAAAGRLEGGSEKAEVSLARVEARIEALARVGGSGEEPAMTAAAGGSDEAVEAEGQPDGETTLAEADDGSTSHESAAEDR